MANKVLARRAKNIARRAGGVAKRTVQDSGAQVALGALVGAVMGEFQKYSDKQKEKDHWSKTWWAPGVVVGVAGHFARKTTKLGKWGSRLGDASLGAAGVLLAQGYTGKGVPNVRPEAPNKSETEGVKRFARSAPQTFETSIPETARLRAL